MHPTPPPTNNLQNSWKSMVSVPPWPKFYPPKFQNWPNFSPRMTSACLYPQVHDFLIRCYMSLKYKDLLFLFFKIWVDFYISFETFVQCKFSKLPSTNILVFNECFTSKTNFFSLKQDPSIMTLTKMQYESL
jgi:hypothetical protein